MADLDDKTGDIAIWNEGRTKVVTVTTDGVKERLDVDAKLSGTGAVDSVVHAGDAFYLTSGAVITVGAGTNFDILIQTGTAKEIHLKDVSVNVLKNSASGNTQFRLYEAPTVSANGTAADIFNSNRRKQGVVTPDFTAFTGPTVTALGTILVNYLTHNDWETYIAPSYTNEWEWILKTNTKYLLRFFNNTNQNNDFTYLYWFFQDDL